jgi:excisionase family DNA binding protein
VKMSKNAQLSLLKAEQVAQILNISLSLAYRLMQNGEIPTVSIGRSKRVRPDDLDGFINKNVTV